MENDRVDDVLSDWAGERPDLESDALGIVLRIQTLAKTLADQVNEVLTSLDLEWWEYDVLATLRRQGEPFRMAATGMAEDMMLSPGAMTNRIDRLERRGLVERIEDPDDRRKVLVQLSAEGLSLVDSASESRFASARSALENLSTAQQNQLDGLLRRMVLAQEASGS